MDQKVIFPILMGGLVVLAILRRVRRNIGRQPVQPGMMWFRIAVLALLGAAFAFGALRDMNLFGALLGGLAAGTALGWFGLRHTRFEHTPDGRFYTPHTWIGVAVSLLLLGRIAYRFLVAYPSLQAAQADGNPYAAMQRSPLTLAILGVLIGYYVYYYVGVLQRSRSDARDAP